MKKLITGILIITINLALAQSTSVFDANYFNMGNKTPLIELGKGFNVTDVYKPTKDCFVNRNATKLIRIQSGQETSIKYFYTKTDDQYNTLKNQGVSGQISYLNLFNVGGSTNSTSLSKSSQVTERIVIVAKVDFGLFTLSADPILKPEAKALIVKTKYDDFIEYYGTHYINGVRKENSIWITLTKKTNTKKLKNTSNTSFNEEFSPLSYGSFKFEMQDNSEIEKAMNSEQYEVSVEIKGPSLGTDIQSSVSSIINGNSGENKMEGITTLINNALKNLSDPSQALITQYYYNPFSLYNLKVIQWNEKKQNELIKLNEVVMTLNTSKATINKLVSPDGLNFVVNKFDKDIPNFKNKEYYKSEYVKAYNNILPSITSYNIELDTTLKYLEKVYQNCSNIYCNIETPCGNTGSYKEKAEALVSKVKTEMTKLSKIKQDAWVKAVNELNKPECEKEGVGYVTVINLSTNPYDFYNGDDFIERLPAKSTLKYKFKPGSYNLKAVQTSGFLMYATVNNRKVTIPQICTEVTIKVGFEDQ